MIGLISISEKSLIEPLVENLSCFFFIGQLGFFYRSFLPTPILGHQPNLQSRLVQLYKSFPSLKLPHFQSVKFTSFECPTANYTIFQCPVANFAYLQCTTPLTKKINSSYESGHIAWIGFFFGTEGQLINGSIYINVGVSKNIQIGID